MTNETLKMQMLAGIITESEYKAKLQENKSSVKTNEAGVSKLQKKKGADSGS